MKQKIFPVLKWIWIVAVAVFIFFILKNYHTELKEAAAQIHASYFLLSFACIFLAKIMLAMFMRYVLHSVEKDLSFSACFNIYNLSQLGKYLPGNIWHFVGKAAAYKKNGFSLGNIRDALFIENIWLVVSALIYGLVLITLFNFIFVQQLLISYYKYVLIFLFITPIIIFITNKVLRVNLNLIFTDSRLCLKIIVLQIFIWSLLGMGFAVPAIPFLPEDTGIFMIVGLYAIAYSIGFVTPFAPAGIGVREGVLALGLLPYMSLDVLVLVSVVNRAIYIIVELFLALISQTVTTAKNRE